MSPCTGTRAQALVHILLHTLSSIQHTHIHTIDLYLVREPAIEFQTAVQQNRQEQQMSGIILQQF